MSTEAPRFPEEDPSDIPEPFEVPAAVQEPTATEDAPTYVVEQWSGRTRYRCLVCGYEGWDLTPFNHHMALYHQQKEPIMGEPHDKPEHPHGTPPGQDPDFVPPGHGGTPPGQEDKPEEEEPTPEHPIVLPEEDDEDEKT